MESPRTPSSDDRITLADFDTACRVLQAVTVHHPHLMTDTAAEHLRSAVTVLQAIGPLVVATQSPARPSNRVDGLCPCELADLAKNARGGR